MMHANTALGDYYGGVAKLNLQKALNSGESVFKFKLKI